MKCETLEVWKISLRLSADVYKALSDCKDFGFRDQITRSGLSVPSNIAEGMEKDSMKERINYFNIAKGSTAEFMTQVFIGMDIGFISEEKGREWIKTGEHVLGILTKLQKAFKVQQG